MSNPRPGARLEASAAIVAAVPAEADLVRLAELTLAQLAALTPGSPALVATFDPTTASLRILATHDWSGSTSVISLGAATVEPLAQGKACLLDSAAWPPSETAPSPAAPASAPAAAPNGTAFLLVPMLAAGLLVGAFALRVPASASPDPLLLERLQPLAEIAAVALRDSTRRAAADRRVAELDVLHRIAERFRTLRRPAELAAEVIGALEEAIGYRYGAVLLLDPPTGRLLPFALSDQGRDAEFLAADEAYVAAMDARLGKGVTGWVAEHGEAVRIGDVSTDPRYLSVRPEIRSELCVPIWIDRGVAGVVNVESPLPDAYTDHDRQLLETVAGQIAAALHNARLYEQIERHAADQERRARELAALQARFQTLVERVPAVIEISALDEPRTSIYVNPQIEEQLGYAPEEWLADPGLWTTRIHPDDRARVLAEHQRHVADGGQFTCEYRMIRRDGRTVWIRDEAVVIQNELGEERHTQGFRFDITRQHELDDDLRQAQKMEAVGQLAAGIAHDFNNLLTVIGGHAQLLRMALPEHDPRAEDVAAIETAAARAVALTGQLLAFGRRRSVEPRVLDLGRVVEETAALLRRLLGEHVRLTTRTEPGGPFALVDRALLEQVIINLAVNARDAMPDGGELSIAVDRLAPEPDPEATPGGDRGQARLLVRDSGFGMDEATRDRIFLPFFTTKEPGKGTGLGLATAYAAIEQAGGSLSVESTPGQGTTFTILLPAVAVDPRDDRPVETSAQPTDATGIASGEHILVVEDDHAVARFATEVLIRAGYRVSHAADGAAGLALIEAHPGGVDLVLTDLVMPGMSGAELVGILRQRHPAVRLLIMSGYADEHMLSKLGVAPLQKPFDPTTLTSAVRTTLTAPTG